jgi:hypothetical protein
MVTSQRLDFILNSIIRDSKGKLASAVEMILKVIQFLFLMLFPIKDALLSQEIIVIAIAAVRNVRL